MRMPYNFFDCRSIKDIVEGLLDMVPEGVDPSEAIIEFVSEDEWVLVYDRNRE